MERTFFGCTLSIMRIECCALDMDSGDDDDNDLETTHHAHL